MVQVQMCSPSESVEDMTQQLIISSIAHYRKLLETVENETPA